MIIQGKQYSIYDDEREFKRALFAINKDDIIKLNYLSPIGINACDEGILEALESLNDNFLMKMAEKLELDVPWFEKDIRKVELEEKVDSDFESGIMGAVKKAFFFCK